MITESSFVHKGLTFITITETNNDGEEICSGCTQPMKKSSPYSQIVKVGEGVKKFFTVHKRCCVKRRIDNGEL